MQVTFEKEYLKTLYETGATDKKHRFQPDIVSRYQRCVDLMLASDIAGLKKIRSLNFEELQGDKKGVFSIRVNIKYRIEFTIMELDTEPVITVCNIIDLSNHYKD